MDNINVMDGMISMVCIVFIYGMCLCLYIWFDMYVSM